MTPFRLASMYHNLLPSPSPHSLSSLPPRTHARNTHDDRGGPEWDPAKQAEMCKEIAKEIGFDFDRGRMDVSVHPFTGGSHPSDVRITTRYSVCARHARRVSLCL